MEACRFVFSMVWGKNKVFHPQMHERCMQDAASWQAASRGTDVQEDAVYYSCWWVKRHACSGRME